MTTITLSRAVWVSVLVAWVGMVHLGVLHVPFMFDDEQTISRAGHLFAALAQGRLISPRPLTDATFAATCRDPVLRPADFQVVDVVIHLLNAMLLFGVIRLVLSRATEGVARASVATPLAFGAACVWAVHPLTTSAVAYISQRYETMMALFFLTASYAGLRALDSTKPRPWLVGSWLATVAGMLCKEVMVVAPLVMAVSDWILFGHDGFRVFCRKRWRWYAGLGLTMLVPLLTGWVAASYSGDVDYNWQCVSRFSYAVVSCHVMLVYLRSVMAPWYACFDLGMSVPEPSLHDIPFCVVIMVFVAGTAWGVVRRRPVALAGVCLFGVLGPTSTFIPRPDPAMEYRMYLPMAGLFAVLIAGVGGWLVTTCRERAVGILRVWLAVTLAVAMGCSVMTVRRTAIFMEPVALWGDTVARNPENLRAHLNLTVAMLNRGDLMGVERSCESLLSGPLSDIARLTVEDIPVNPTSKETFTLYTRTRYYSHAHNYLGVALAQQGVFEQAKVHFEEALRLLPNFESAAMNLESVNNAIAISK